MSGQLKRDPVKRVWQLYRMTAVWGSLLLSATFIENLPFWNGRLWLLPFFSPIAGVRQGRIVGLFVGIAAGFLHDWTANGLFGVAGVVLGAVGYVCGVLR